MPDATTTVVIENPAVVDGLIPGQEQQVQSTRSDRRAEVPTPATRASRAAHKLLHPLSSTKFSDDNAVMPKGPPIPVNSLDVSNRMVGVPNVDRNGHLREGEKAPEIIGIPEEVVDGVRGFIQTFTQRLLDMKHDMKDPNTWRDEYPLMKEELGRGGNFSYGEDEFMLEMFTKKNAAGAEEIKSAEEINQMLKENPDLIDDTMIWLERMGEEIGAAEGIRPVFRGEKYTFDPATGRTIRTGADAGPIRKAGNALMEYLRAHPGEMDRGPRGIGIRQLHLDPTHLEWIATLGASGAIVGGALGSIGGPIGASFGAVAGGAAAPVVLSSVADLFADGVIIDLVDAPELRTQSQRLGEARRARFLYGVDPNAGPNVPSPRRAFARDEMLAIIYLRAAYMKALDVPAQNLEPFSSSFVYGPDLAHPSEPEVIDNKTRNQIIEVWKTMEGPIAPTPADRRDIYKRAMEFVMLESKLPRMLLELKPTDNDPLTRLAEQKKAFTPGTPEFKTRVKSTQEEIQLLSEKDGPALVERRSHIAGYETALRTIESKSKELEAALDSIQRGGVRIGDLPTTIAALRLLATGAAPAGGAAAVAGLDITLPDENGAPINIRLISYERARINKAWASTKIRPQQPGELIKDFNTRYDREKIAQDNYFTEQLRNLNGREDPQLPSSHLVIITKTIRKLTELQTQINTAEREAASSTASDQGNQAAREINEAYGIATAMPGGAALPATLTDALKSGDIRLVMSEINAAGIWGTSENTLPQRRLQAWEAITQTRANELMKTNPTMAAWEGNFNTVRATNITPDQLRAFSVAELTALPLAAGLTTAQLTDAKNWATTQIGFVSRALNEQSQRITERSERLNNEISVAPEALLARIDITENLIKDRGDGKIYARTVSELTDPRTRAHLLDTTPVSPATGGITQAEITSGLPRNILELLNILTNYRNKPNSGAEFQKIWTALGGNADRLVPLVMRGFWNYIAPPGPVTATSLADGISTSINSRRLTSANMKEPISETINEFDRWTSLIQ